MTVGEEIAQLVGMCLGGYIALTLYWRIHK